jgi:hypothetical protein
MALPSPLLACLVALAVALGTPEAPPVEPPVDEWLDSVLLLVTGSAWCSAVLVDDQGTVATAYHCIASGRRPQVTTRDGQRHLARVVATAPRDDLALLEVPELAGRVGLEIRPVPARIGETVWALGHPFAPQAESSALLAGTLTWSVSRGVVSAVGQRLTQVDAALNPGNSGGPVVDDQGRVVGIASRRLSGDNVAFISPSGGLVQLQAEPRKPLLGGTWGVGLAALQGLDVHSSPSVGVVAQLGLRDTLLLRGGLYLPVGQRWAALSLGSSTWTAAELASSLRLRLGRGRFSTTVDLGGVCLVQEALQSEVADDAVHLWAVPGGLAPGGVVSIGMGGSSLRGLWVRDSEGWTAVVGVDLGFPGVLGVF